jgi:hypothetical protein
MLSWLFPLSLLAPRHATPSLASILAAKVFGQFKPVYTLLISGIIRLEKTAFHAVIAQTLFKVSNRYAGNTVINIGFIAYII